MHLLLTPKHMGLNSCALSRSVPFPLCPPPECCWPPLTAVTRPPTSLNWSRPSDGSLSTAKQLPRAASSLLRIPLCFLLPFQKLVLSASFGSLLRSSGFLWAARQRIISLQVQYALFWASLIWKNLESKINIYQTQTPIYIILYILIKLKHNYSEELIIQNLQPKLS